MFYYDYLIALKAEALGIRNSIGKTLEVSQQTYDSIERARLAASKLRRLQNALTSDDLLPAEALDDFSQTYKILGSIFFDVRCVRKARILYKESLLWCQKTSELESIQSVLKFICEGSELPDHEVLLWSPFLQQTKPQAQESKPSPNKEALKAKKA